MPMTVGLTAATTRPARVTVSAKIDQSGSSSGSQCDLLLGSFQNIAASIIVQPLGNGVSVDGGSAGRLVQRQQPRTPGCPSPPA